MGMEAQENKEKSFWDCEHGYYAGGCRCRKLGGDNICLLELNNDNLCPYYEETII